LVNATHAASGGLGVHQPRCTFQKIGLLMVEMHDAVFGFAVRAVLGFGDIGGSRDEHLPPAGMASRLPSFVIALDLPIEIGASGVAHRGKDWEPTPADRRKRVGGAGRDANRRGRLLIRLWYDCNLFETVVFALVREAGLGPGLLDDIEYLAEAVPAFG